MLTLSGFQLLTLSCSRLTVVIRVVSAADSVAVRVPFGAKENMDRIGLADRDAIPHDIEMEVPRTVQLTRYSLMRLNQNFSARASSTISFLTDIDSYSRIQIAPADFNFVDDEFVLSITDSGDVDWISG